MCEILENILTFCYYLYIRLLQWWEQKLTPLVLVESNLAAVYEWLDLVESNLAAVYEWLDLACL